ncbi:MAG: hypothetical protein HYR62_01370 [Actinobacteria bacterium]|nr:hypothetical protein [Actinomycetota bacterium]MBI3688825.1 hypothetical protein [Actinomycetota bacterium]
MFVPALVVVVTLLSVAVFLPAWRSLSDQRTFTVKERAGVAYLTALPTALSALLDAEAAAVRGAPLDKVAQQRAFDAVDAADARLGGILLTTQRWSTLRARIQTLSTQRFTDQIGAYVAYTEVVDLMLGLYRKIGDESNLILDPELDTYYLMNAAMLRLPPVMVNASRLADLVSILPSVNGRARVEMASSIATARTFVATDAADLQQGLTTAIDRTTRSDLGTALLGQLDEFHRALESIAPSTMLVGMPHFVDTVANVVPQRDTLMTTSVRLARVALTELDGLLSGRADGFDGNRTVFLIALVLGVTLTIVALAAMGWFLWSRSPVQGRSHRDDSGGGPRQPGGGSYRYGPSDLAGPPEPQRAAIPAAEEWSGAR